MLIVQKYGGTSVGSIERMKTVAARCLASVREGHQVAVVVSAMSGETNRLLKLVGELHDDPNDREVDVIVSTGEQVSVGLVALAIRAAGGKARSFLGHQCKILTDSSFSRARIVEIDAKPIKGERPTEYFPWGVNVCRQRMAGNRPEYYMLSPGGTKFNDRVLSASVREDFSGGGYRWLS